MTPEDLDRLRKWVGLSHAHHFRPDQSPGDEMILVEKLLGEGNCVLIAMAVGVYQCSLRRKTVAGSSQAAMAEAPTRREALCLAALGVCP